MTIEKLKELGWKYDSMWNNRMFYSLSEESKYAIFEHNGDWGLLDPFKKNFTLIYCNLTDNEIITFTELVKEIENIIYNPKDHTLYEYMVTGHKMSDFCEEMEKRS